MKKSLELGLKPILVLNKIDKPAADVKMAQDAVYELFFELGASEEQLDFKTVYAIGRDGTAKIKMEDELKDLTPLMDLVLEEVPAASGEEKTVKPLKAQVFNLAYDNFLGRMGVCRIYEGVIKDAQKVFAKDTEGNVHSGKLSKLFSFEGVNKNPVEQAVAGDIIMVSGLPDIFIGQTLVDAETTEPMPEIKVDEPTVSFNMVVNDSPFVGRAGKLLTSRQIRERLEKELEVNVGLKVDFSEQSKFKVYGRGELHLAILIENMRREGFELAVSQPEVIIKDVDGVKSEPFEEATIVVPEEFSGSVIEKMGKRKGLMQNMENDGKNVKMIFLIPTRGLLGYRNEFVVDTRGEGILTTIFAGFKPYAGTVTKTEFGSMISMENGKALAFALDNLQTRGVLYIPVNTEVYEGMVIGYTVKGEDMVVNPTKGKQLTNMRASGTDEAVKVIPPLLLTLELAMSMVRGDELLEVTPDAVRLRKTFLKEGERKRGAKN